MCGQTIVQVSQLTTCDHFACASCLFPWIQFKGNCPVCRRACSVDTDILTMKVDDDTASAKEEITDETWFDVPECVERLDDAKLPNVALRWVRVTLCLQRGHKYKLEVCLSSQVEHLVDFICCAWLGRWQSCRLLLHCGTEMKHDQLIGSYLSDNNASSIQVVTLEPRLTDKNTTDCKLGTIRLSIKPIDFPSIMHLHANPNSCVRLVKEWVSTQFQVCADDIRLIAKGRPLIDDKTLAECNVDDRSLIHVYWCMRGS